MTRRYEVDVSGMPEDVTDEEVRAALAQAVGRLARTRGAVGFSVGTANAETSEVEAALAALSPDESRHIHNVHAHPLLVLCPPLGEWLHARTDP